VKYVQSPVEHPWIYWNDRVPVEQNFEDNIQRIYPVVTLHKSHFWEKEDEQRLVMLNQTDTIYLPIVSCLKAIHLGLGFPRVYLPAIESLLNEEWDVKIYQTIYQNDAYARWLLKKPAGKWLSYADDED
jgi:hypothetical protein